MLSEDNRNEIIKLAKEKGIPAAALLAVCDVESGGKVFSKVKGRDEPLIRFEGHYFYRLLGAAKRNNAVVQGLASRKAGGVKNPRTQAGRWNLLARASEIDRDAALQSCSWGIGQVMGAHWRWLDYASVDAMVVEVRSGVTGQVQLMLKFIEKAGLISAIRNKDWRVFARGYNGPSYAKNDYDRKLAKAFDRYNQLLGNKPARRRANKNGLVMLQYGDRGDLVRDLQMKLQAYGVAIAVDGDFGPVTKRAVTVFQRNNGLLIDGIAGPQTFLALERVTKGI